MRKMDQEVLKFIETCTNYCRHRTEPAASDLQRCLETLSGTHDLDAFKTSNTSASNFYVSLHDLLNILNINSTQLWPTISVLQKVCDVNRTKMGVIQSYKFIPVLTRFLDESLPTDKLYHLLALLSDLTYGVKIAWQESHLPVLIATLTKVILGDDKKLLSPALTTLVNLCHKNTPALFVLTRKVEIKAFMKALTKMNDDLSVRVQVCKLLMIFGELKGRMPPEETLHFVDVTIKCINEAFLMGDVATLRQIVDFFKDVDSDPQLHETISKYPKILEDTKRLIALMDTIELDVESFEDSVAILLECIATFLKINPQKTVKLLEPLLTEIMPWIHKSKTCLPVMNLLLVMVTEVMQTESGQLLEMFPVTLLVNMLNWELNDESRKEQVALAVAVLTEASAISSTYRQQILESCHCNLMEDLFDKIFKSGFFYENCLTDESSTNKLCIQLIFFVATLSAFSEDWKKFYSKILEKNETICSIAVGILNGDNATRLRAFRLTSSWDNRTLSRLCETMNNMRQISVTRINDEPTQRLEWVSISCHEQRIKELLESFKTEAKTSAAVELFEYKLSTMEQSERHLNTALEAADKRCITLNHQLAQLQSTVARLHQSLFDTQYVLEGRTAEKTDLAKQLEDLVNKTTLEKNKQSQKMKNLAAAMQELENKTMQQGKDIASKDSLLEEYQNKLMDMTQAHESAAAQCEEQKIQLAKLISQLEEMTLVREKLSEELKKCENEVVACKAQIGDYQAQNLELQDSLTKSLEESSQKGELLADYERKIAHLEHIREAVISVARKDRDLF